MKKYLIILFTSFILTGCARSVSPVQISQMSNYSLVKCMHRFMNSDETKMACGSEIQKRLASNKMAQIEYSQDESQVIQQKQNSFANMGGYIERQQALDEQRYEAQMKAMNEIGQPVVNENNYYQY